MITGVKKIKMPLKLICPLQSQLSCSPLFVPCAGRCWREQLREATRGAHLGLGLKPLKVPKAVSYIYKVRHFVQLAKN